MKKTTQHGRKLKRLGVQSSAHEKRIATLVTIHKLKPTLALHKPYSDPENTADADRIMASVRMSLYKLANGLATGDDGLTHYWNLCDHIGTSQVHTLQIHGDKTDALATLNAAAIALRRVFDRHKRLNAWGLDGPGLIALTDGVKLAETILRAAQHKYLTWNQSTAQRKAA